MLSNVNDKAILFAVIFWTISFLYTALQIWKLSRRRRRYDIEPKMKNNQPNDNSQRVPIFYESSNIEFDEVEVGYSHKEKVGHCLNDNDLLIQPRRSLASSSHEDMERTISIDPKDAEKCFGRIVFLRVNGKACTIEQMPERIIDHDISIIGRELGCEIQISDQRISRRHARLTRCNGKIYIEDLNSTNGTRINGTFLLAGQKRELDKDSLVEIGFTAFRVFPPEKL